MRRVSGSAGDRAGPAASAKARVEPVSAVRSTHPAADAIAVGAAVAATLMLVCARLLGV